jgi:hypothetical protein
MNPATKTTDLACTGCGALVDVRCHPVHPCKERRTAAMQVTKAANQARRLAAHNVPTSE